MAKFRTRQIVLGTDLPNLMLAKVFENLLDAMLPPLIIQNLNFSLMACF